jgi:hypothetical protein
VRCRSKPCAASIGPVTSNVRTELKDVHEKIWGDVGLVTCWVEQDYTYKRKRTHISSPTSVAFRRLRGPWKIVLFHAIPLPESA